MSDFLKECLVRLCPLLFHKLEIHLLQIAVAALCMLG